MNYSLIFLDLPFKMFLSNIYTLLSSYLSVLQVNNLTYNSSYFPFPLLILHTSPAILFSVTGSKFLVYKIVIKMNTTIFLNKTIITPSKPHRAGYSYVSLFFRAFFHTIYFKRKVVNVIAIVVTLYTIIRDSLYRTEPDQRRYRWFFKHLKLLLVFTLIFDFIKDMVRFIVNGTMYNRIVISEVRISVRL